MRQGGTIQPQQLPALPTKQQFAAGMERVDRLKKHQHEAVTVLILAPGYHTPHVAVRSICQPIADKPAVMAGVFVDPSATCHHTRSW